MGSIMPHISIVSVSPITLLRQKLKTYIFEYYSDCRAFAIAGFHIECKNFKKIKELLTIEEHLTLGCKKCHLHVSFCK